MNRILRGPATTLRLFFAAAAALAACGEGRSFVVRPSLGAEELGFVAVMGRAFEVYGPFAEGSELGRALEVQVEPDAELLLVRVSKPQLGELVPRLDERRWPELRLVREQESCAEGRLLVDAERHALRRHVTGVLRLEGDRFEGTDTPEILSLEIPVDESSCFSGQAPTLRPFGGEPRLLPAGSRVGESTGAFELDAMNRLLPMGAGYVLAHAGPVLFVFARGEAWQDAPRFRLEASVLARQLGHQEGYFSGLVLDPRSAAGAHRLVFSFEGDRGAAFYLIEATWSEDVGFGPARVLSRLEADLDGLWLEGEDRWLGVGDRGAVTRGTLDGGELEHSTIVAGGNLRGALFTGDPREPHILHDSNLSLYFGDARSRTWRRESGPGLFGGVAGAVQRLTPTGREVVLAPFRAELVVYRAGSGWSSRPIPIPAGLDRCAGPRDACGRSHAASQVGAIAMTPQGTTLLALQSCGAILELDFDRGCSRSIPIEGAAPQALIELWLRTIGVEGGRLWVGGKEGLVLETAWPD